MAAFSSPSMSATCVVTFSLASGLLPGLLEGVINMNTGKGSGSVTCSDTGKIETLTYSAFSPPCVLP